MKCGKSEAVIPTRNYDYSGDLQRLTCSLALLALIVTTSETSVLVSGATKWCVALQTGETCFTLIPRSRKGRSMNTYQPTPLAIGLLSDEPLEPQHLGYLRARTQNKAHDCVLETFINEAEERGINKAYIARRLGKRPEVVGRCLTAPGNWTLDTLSELLGSMGYEVEFRARSFRHPNLPNRVHDLMVANPVSPSAETGPLAIHSNVTTATSTTTGSFIQFTKG